jgi:hypothetical protein
MVVFIFYKLSSVWWNKEFECNGSGYERCGPSAGSDSFHFQNTDRGPPVSGPGTGETGAPWWLTGPTRRRHPMLTRGAHPRTLSPSTIKAAGRLKLFPFNHIFPSWTKSSPPTHRQLATTLLHQSSILFAQLTDVSWRLFCHRLHYHQPPPSRSPSDHATATHDYWWAPLCYAAHCWPSVHISFLCLPFACVAAGRRPWPFSPLFPSSTSSATVKLSSTPVRTPQLLSPSRLRCSGV